MVRRCTAQYVTEDNAPLEVWELSEFLSELPTKATLTAIVRDIGDQRDPQHVFVGIKAEWEES